MGKLEIMWTSQCWSSLKNMACLLLVAWSFACAPAVDDEETQRFRREFQAFLTYLPSSEDKDSLMEVAIDMDANQRNLLRVSLEAKHAEIIERTRAQEARQQKIRSQFDLRTNAHIKVQQSVQESMNDPNSFEHVSTSYTEHTDHLMVDMHFRMPISPGVTMMHRIQAKVDLEGNVLDGEITRIKE